MRQRLFSIVLKSASLIIVGVLMFCFIRALCLERKRLSAIFNCADIHTLRAKHGSEIVCERAIIRNGERYEVIYLRVNDVFMSLPSGPPIMVFNSCGNKVAACADSGDSSSFYEDWLFCEDLVSREKVEAKK